MGLGACLGCGLRGRRRRTGKGRHGGKGSQGGSGASGRGSEGAASPRPGSPGDVALKSQERSGRTSCSTADRRTEILMSSDGDYYDCISEFSDATGSDGRAINKDGLVKHSIQSSMDVSSSPDLTSSQPLPGMISNLWDALSRRGQTAPVPSNKDTTSDGAKSPPEVADVLSVERDGESVSTSSAAGEQVGQLQRLSGCLSLLRGPSLGASHRGKKAHRKRYPTKPQAGASLQRLDPLEDYSTAAECWEPGDPTTYKIRSRHYMKNRLKEPCAGSFYELMDVDLLSFDTKEHHIARRLTLPQDPHKRTEEEQAAIVQLGIPVLLVINVQLPIYQPALFGGVDGVGHSMVYFFALREGFNPLQAENQGAVGLLRRFVHNGREENGDMTRNRLKLIPKVINVEEWSAKAPLSRTEAHLVGSYNSKPLLTRPQHTFHHGPGYMEIDVDVHAYAYLARRALQSFTARLHTLVFENAFVIQGNREEELPEMILGVARMHRIDFMRMRPFSEAAAATAKGDAEAEDDGVASGDALAEGG
ncbi:unnamed protein product [Ostreobium quekettii]|uniref:Protein ENHANCED DISEASE RESISTANCE 2 C-terminal domain-containing protein n=1 Tax=Ostreobium quekettii TaxID=121088 RepID=A0A8S1IRL3_9CHLO|nr:unnamed protein product [Ostreobium quekettii]|eukprot:evm.model.scf_172EXC.3 EVM.evm.TU.scf_172EXC.3   scf_172EXC:53398-62802(-)